MTLRARPTTIKAAEAIVLRWHRHLKRRPKHLWAVAIEDEHGTLRGVAIVGLPIAAAMNDGRTCEVHRCATDGTRNACSKLYSLCRRVAQTMGYRRCLTKTLEEESGSSLRALGLEPLGLTKAEGWSRPSREREEPEQGGRKWRWDLLARPEVA